MSGTVAPDLPVWAQWFAALAVPIAAVIGVLLGVLNFLLSRRKRRDELFDRRYEAILQLDRLFDDACRHFATTSVFRVAMRQEIGLSKEWEPDPSNFEMAKILLLHAESMQERSDEIAKEHGKKIIDEFAFSFIHCVRMLRLEIELLFGDKYEACIPYEWASLDEFFETLRKSGLRASLIEMTRLT